MRVTHFVVHFGKLWLKESHSMNSKNRSAVSRVIVILGFLIVITGLVGTVSGQKPTQTTDAEGNITTTGPDNKYGEGGTRSTTSDKKLHLIKEAYVDKCGRFREVYGKIPDSPDYYRLYTDERGKNPVSVRLLKEGDIYEDESYRKLDPEKGKALVEKYQKTPSAPCDDKTSAAAPPVEPKEPPKKEEPKKVYPPPTDDELKRETIEDTKFELFGGFTYVRAPDESAKNLVGFNASLFYDLTPHVAVGGEVSAAFGSDQIGTTTLHRLHRTSFLAGPQIRYPAVCSFERVSLPCTEPRASLFARVILGVVHDSGSTTIGTATVSGSSSAFAMALGGGVDVRLNKHISFRPIAFDYIPTHFGGAWQSNYRLSSGIVFRLGGK